MNCVVLTGRLARDPECRMAGEKLVARFPLAVDRYGDGADFPMIVCFEKQAETVDKYLHKGNRVAVNGRISTGSYEKPDGTKVYTTEVIANNVEFLETKKEAQQSQPGFAQQNGFQEQSQQGFQQQNSQQQFPQQNQQQGNQQGGFGWEEIKGDIPF